MPIVVGRATVLSALSFHLSLDLLGEDRIMRSNLPDRKRATNSSATQPNTPQKTQKEDSISPLWGRRGFLRAAGGVAVAGLLAGCTNARSEGESGSSSTSGGNSATSNSGKGSVDAWLADTGNYDSVKDLRSRKSITIEVGAEGNNGAYAFEPAAIRISPGTTVVWKWVDGYHNVAEKDGEFTSGEPELNTTFEYMFETSGTVLYVCEPHESMGMKGAVIVAEEGTKLGNSPEGGENQ